MSYKVFLFEPDSWLYCENVSFENGVYHGWVINGGWHLMYDTKIEGFFACYSREAADSLVAVTKGNRKLVWACDPFKKLFDYNIVIEGARVRYARGELANYILTEPVVVDGDDLEDEVPF